MTECPGRYLDPSAERSLGAATLPKRALFLDRDGVVNVDHGYVHDAGSTQWLPGIFELCREAIAAGYLPVVVTNQAGIARGYYDEPAFRAYTAWVHARFQAQDAPLLATYYCPHHPTAGLGDYRRECDCRKPGPGMLLRAAADFGLDLAASVLVGDTDSDLMAAQAAGVGRACKVDGRIPGLDALLAQARE